MQLSNFIYESFMKGTLERYIPNNLQKYEDVWSMKNASSFYDMCFN